VAARAIQHRVDALGRDTRRTNEVYLPMNGVYNDWLLVEAEKHQSWPPKKLTN